MEVFALSKYPSPWTLFLSSRWTRLRGSIARHALLVLTLVVAVRFVSVLAGVVAQRVLSPGDLEWMEFGILGHVVRILEGKSIFGPPELGFVPYIYTPLYYYVGAALAPVFGVGLVQLRVVSVLATCATSWLIFETLRRAGARRAATVLAPALFLGTYLSSGAWMDVARVDSLWLFFQMGALRCAMGTTRLSPVLTALAIVAGALTKQYALVLLVPMGLHFLLRGGLREWTVFVLAAFVFGALGFGYFHVQSQGWVWFWIWSLPQRHAAMSVPWLEIVRHQGLLAMPFLVLVGLSGLLFVFGRLKKIVLLGEARPEWPLLLVFTFAVTCGVQAYLSYRHSGSFLNCLMPYHLGVTLLAGVALGRGARRAQSVLLLACSLHFFQMELEPKLLRPSRQDVRNARGLLRETLAESPTAVASHHAAALLPSSLRLAHPMALVDLERAGEPKMMEKLRREAEQRFAAQPYEAVILDDEFYPFLGELRRHYRLDSELSRRPASRMLVGASVAPSRIYVRRSAPASARSQ